MTQPPTPRLAGADRQSRGQLDRPVGAARSRQAEVALQIVGAHPDVQPVVELDLDDVVVRRLDPRSAPPLSAPAARPR